MKLNIRKSLMVLAFFLLTFSNASYMTNHGYDDIILYAGLGLLSLACFREWTKAEKLDRLSSLAMLTLTIIMLCTGICVQSMELQIKVRLCFLMIFIAIFSIWGRYIFKNYKDIFDSIKAILLGCFFALIIATVTANPFTVGFSGVVSALYSRGFNGGLQHKNYFAAVMVISFIGTYLYDKYERRSIYNKGLMLLEVLFLVSSVSRGGYVIFLFFVAVERIALINRVRANQRIIVQVFSLFVLILTAYEGYKFVSEFSSTYMYRLRGLTNYLEMFKTDLNSMMFGIAGIAYSGSDYGNTIRSIVGWDGTVELTILNILIKNGLLGMLMFVIIFVSYAKSYMREKDKNMKISFWAVLVSVLISTLVENYMVTMHIVYGPFCYCMMASFFQWSKVKGNQQSNYTKFSLRRIVD